MTWRTPEIWLSLFMMVVISLWARTSTTRRTLAYPSGRAAAEKKPQVVPDVHAFPGHIPCDGASRSELVIPFLAPGGEVAGVLDLDSPLPGRFTEEDLAGLLPIARLLEEACL